MVGLQLISGIKLTFTSLLVDVDSPEAGLGR